MEMRVPITGSFAEFRNHSLHLGCDFKTYWMNGFPVLSPFDAYISQIRYSERGYGLSMNLYSPKYKMTTKIAHLSTFSNKVKGLNELKEALLLLSPKGTFRLNLRAKDFPVAKGKRVARTGESGSGISHLHMELYNNKAFYNPLSFPDFQQADTTPPHIQIIYLDDTGSSTQWLKVEKNEQGQYQLKKQEEIHVMGNLKFRVAAYDIMTARNHNGIYGLRLFINEKLVFHKKLDKLLTRHVYARSKLYDLNRSSLSPSHYVYNLFPAKGAGQYSLQMQKLSKGDRKNIKIEVYDVSNNISSIRFTVQKAKKKKVITPSKAGSQKRLFQSDDKILQLNFAGLQIKGKGDIQIQQLASLPKEVPVDKLAPMSTIYEIKNNDFSWKGGAWGNFKGDYRGKESDLYIYDLGIRKWLKLTHKKTSRYIRFWLRRTGYIAVMKDKTPPKIQYPYLFYRDFNLKPILTPGMEEKFYQVHESGAGIKKMQVLLEGQEYPFTYDKDRKFIKVEIPKSGFGQRLLLLQIQVTDAAGNASPWFTDIYTPNRN